MLFLTVAVAEVDDQMFRQIKFMQRVAGGGNIFSVVVRFFTAAHDDVPIRVATRLVDGHLSVFIRREKHMAGAGGANSVNGNASIAIRTIFKADRTRERRSHFPMDLAFGGTRANRSPTDQIGNKLASDHIKKLCGGRYSQFVHLQ